MSNHTGGQQMRITFKKRLVQSAVLALSVLLALTCFACTKPEPEDEPVEEPVFVYESPYDWSNLVRENGRLSYMKGWMPASVSGIDVSEHQGVIDWDAVAADGIDFAIIRLGTRGYTEGLTYFDIHFYENLEGARNAGIKVGVYFFSQAINDKEALEEAEFAIRALENIPLDYPVFFDYETISDYAGRANNLTDEQLTRNAKIFCDYIAANGYTPMIYGNIKILERIDPELRDLYGVWLAEYGVQSPNAQFDFIMWQYSNSGIVAGIDSPVDMDILFLYP